MPPYDSQNMSLIHDQQQTVQQNSFDTDTKMSMSGGGMSPGRISPNLFLNLNFDQVNTYDGRSDDCFLTAFFTGSLRTLDLRITCTSFLLPRLSVNWIMSLVDTTWMGLQVSSRWLSSFAGMMLEVHSKPTIYSDFGIFVTRTYYRSILDKFLG